MKSIDISGWTIDERSIRYRLTKDHTVIGILTGDTIYADGSADISVTCGNRGGQWWKPGMPAYGTKEREWTFPANSKVDEEIIRQLRINTGDLKPGTPLPDELQKLVDIAVKGVIEKSEAETDGEERAEHSVADQPDGPSPTRKVATRNPELRRVVPKKA